MGGAQNVDSYSNVDDTASVGGAQNVGGTASASTMCEKDLIQVRKEFVVVSQDSVRVIFRAP